MEKGMNEGSYDNKRYTEGYGLGMWKDVRPMVEEGDGYAVSTETF